MSQYEDYLSSLKVEDDKRNQLVSSLSEAATTNPDEFASMVKLSRAAKIDLESVPEYKDEAKQAKFLGDVGLERLWKDAPKTTQFLATPEHAKMASDDIENLSGIEGALNWTANRGRAIAAAVPKMNAGLWGMGAAPFELVGADSIGGFMRDMQKSTDATAKRWGPQDKPGWMVNSIDQGLTSFGQNMLTLPMAFLPGGQNAALTAMVAPVFGESYGKGRDAGLSPAQSIQFGTQDAAAEYVFERFGLGNLVKNVKSGTGLGKTMVQFMMREVPSEMATTVVQSFDEYANINPNKPVGEWLSQLPDELAQTVIATLVGGSAISASAKAVQKTMQIASYRQQEAQDAESGAGFIETLNKFIGASTTLQRDPETFERFIEQATENGPVENIYINAQTLQQSGIAEQLAQVSPAIAEQFQTAIETGGDIRIPVAEYASKIAPTEFAQSLVDHLKVDENGFSRAEAQEYMQSQGEELQAHIERVMTENEGDTTFKASVETVKETIRSQLDTANRFTSQNNEAFSTLTATFFAVTAARLGMTPEALYSKYPLRVVAESIAGQQFDQSGNQKTDTPEFRNWFGDSKVVDSEGKPLVVYHGTGADFSIFDLGRGGEATGNSAGERGFFFVDNSEMASAYAENTGKKSNVMPVYLALSNPERRTFRDIHQLDYFISTNGIADEGMIAKLNTGETVYVTNDPSAVKSAIGNNGNFDPNDANILNQGGKLVTDTPAFKNWFGESKVVDAEGKPLVVYHGTTKDFDEFSVTSDIGFHFGNIEQADAFTRSRFGVKGGANIKPVFLQLKRPMVIDFDPTYFPGDHSFLTGNASFLKNFHNIANYGVGESPLSFDDLYRSDKAFKAAVDASEKADALAIKYANDTDKYDWSDFQNSKTLSAMWAKVQKYIEKKGFDGIIYENEVEGSGVSYSVFSASQIKSAIGNRGTFDPADANILNQQARASFNPATLQMSLLKNADLSSFLHESGHFFLEVQFDIAAQLQKEAAIHGVDTLKEGEQEYLRDTKAVLDWFGITDLNEWNNLDFEEKRSYHERYAESFEAYLFSGKAPSIELAPLFQKFRAFLTSVYTSLKNFLAGHPEAGKLNDEVIAVFDKMLATNEQILLAEQARSMMPLFDANDGTITPEEYASLQALGIAGTNEAIQELQAKGLRDLQWARNAKSKELRRLQRESKGIRDELTMQARREIMSQPVYQVWSFLTKKLSRDDMTDLEQTRVDYREILKVWNDGRKAEEEKQRAAAKQEVWESSEEGRKKYRKDGAMLKAQQKVLRREDRLIDDLTAKAIGEWEQKNPKPRDPEARAKSDPGNVDETQDSLFAAIAKLGGINKRELVETWGIDPADKAASGVFGKHVMRAEDKGLSIDGMVEALSQYGYLTLDEHGKADMRELEDKFKSELGGDTKYSNAYDYSADLQASPIINPAALSAGRLDMAGLSEIGLPPEIINHLKALRMTAKDGLHPDMVAEVVGNFGSGDEMVRAIVSAKPPKEAIADRAQELMEQNHGELANDEAIDREANKAIHNEVRARAVEAELNALAKATNQREPTGNLDKNGKPITRPVLATAAREFAAQMIGRLKVRDIKPSQYANSEAKAARAADKAKKAGDVAQAMAEKRNQLINLYLTKSAYAGQDEAGDIVRYLSKFDREGTRKALANDYLVQIDAILERFDLRKGQSLKAIDKRDSLARFIESQAEAGIEPEIPDWLVLESNKMHYKNLTLDELRAVNESVRQIEHLGRLKNKLLTAKDARELNEIVQEISASMIANSPGLVDNEARNEIGSKISQMWRGAMAAHRKAASVVRQMDGFKDGGPMWEYFIRSMNEAGEREASMRADAAEKLHALAKPVMEAGKLGGKGKFFPALNRNLNRGEIIAMALNIGNESNLQRLLGGKNWTVGQIKPALDTLTATDWAFVQGVWDFFESYRPEIGAKQMRVYGTEPDWIEPGNPFLQMLSAEKGLSLRGGYYPVKYDPRQSGKSAEFDEKQAAQDMMRAANTAATTRRSFTKSRVEEVKGRPLLLSFDGIWQGANEVIHDLTWHEWLIDANRLMKRLDEPMRDHYGAEYVNVLRASIKDSAQGDMPATNHIQRGLNHLRIGATVAGLGWNLTTSLLQPIGLTQSVVRIGAPWVARGLKSFYNSPIAKAEEVQAKSEFMRNRGRTFMREINDVRNRLEADKGEVRSMVESSFFVLIQKMQATVDYPTWLGAYEKAIAAGNDEARSIGLADQSVIDSQGGGQIKDLAEVQRGHPVFKLFTNFYSFFNVALNLTVERTKGTNFHKPAEVAALAGDYVLLLILPSAIGAVLKSVLKGGDDDEEKLLKKIAEEQIGFLLGLFVGLREITSGVQMALGVGNPGIGYSGPAGARFFAEMQKLGQQIGQGEADMALFKAANSTGGILFHYPAGQVNRAVEGTAALIDGRTNNPLAPLVGPPPKN